MSPTTYHRPKTIEQALELLEQGVPLAGGTVLTPVRRTLDAVIDLQDLGLDQFEAADGHWLFGAALPLQRLYEQADQDLPALAQALRLQAAWNMRNQATFIGTVLSANGRSPLLCAALALNPELSLAAQESTITLAQFLQQRDEEPPSLITGVDLELPAAMAYQQTGRAPMDRPLVSAAACRFAGVDGGDRFRLILGGYGALPQALDVASLTNEDEVEAAVQAARDSYRAAGDQWASAEYRSDVAGTLAGRVAREVMA